MKRTLKFLSMLLVVVMATANSVMPVKAASTGYYDSTNVSGASKFTSEWEMTRTYKIGSTTIGYMIYGYDTDWINEDYVWTKATECYSKAMVYRNGYDSNWDYCEGSEKGKNSYSKIEVTHRTYYVYYKMYLSASYSGVSYTTASSSVK